MCCVNHGFTPIYLRTSCCQSSPSLPKPCQQKLVHNIADLFAKVADTRGEILREAAWDALFLFRTLVLGPQKPGASSSSVKAEITTRLDLWNKGKLNALAARARSLICPPLRQK
jgi:hypothetical protein